MGGKANVKDVAPRNRRVLHVAGPVILACGLLAHALLAPPRASAATNYAPGRPLAVVARAAGDEEVYWRGADGYLWEDAESGGQWRGPMRTPIGSLGSSPAATIGSHGYDYVFWEGTNGQLWEAADYPTGWTAPTQLGFGPLGSQPTATSWTTSSGVAEIDVFWEGTGGALWRANYETSTGKWTGPSRLGMGPLGSPPTATEQGTSAGAQIQVYWKGATGRLALWEADTSGGATWSGPTSHGMGPLGSAPAVASLGYGNETVFWGGTFGRLWQANWDSASWNGVNLNGPISVGFGPMASAPTVAAVPPNEYDVFWVGTDSDLWEAQLVGQTWTSVQSRGPMVASPPAPTPRPATGTVTISPPKSVSTVPRSRMDVKILMTWHWNGDHTRLRGVRFRHLPALATIRVACHGRGCPMRARSARQLNLRRLIKSLKASVFSAGQQLTITISAPGRISERGRVFIRNGKKPRAKVL
jgi:hypothetical protein